MNPWGKFGKEYYSWHIENIQQLESYIIHRNIDVDSYDSFWPTLQHQLTGNRMLLGGDDLILRSPDTPNKYYRFAYHAVVVF